MDEPCTHPRAKIKPGPRVPGRWGSHPTEVCECGAWRSTLHVAGPWRTDITIEQAQEPDDEL